MILFLEIKKYLFIMMNGDWGLEKINENIFKLTININKQNIIFNIFKFF